MPTEHFKTQSNEQSSKNSCHHERHLNGIALKVYNLHWRLSKRAKDGTVAITNPRIAKLVGVRPGKRADYISRVKTSLVRDGWLEFLGVSKGTRTGTWAGGRYRPVSHEDWVECKTAELGHSPCHPKPLLNQVSLVKPGGRAYQQKAAEVHTVKRAEVHTAVTQKRSHRVGSEVRTDCVVGSTRTVCSGKYTQSVDFSTGGFQPRRERQLIQGELPPESPQSEPTAAIALEGGKPPSKTPPEEKPLSPWERERIEREAKAREFAEIDRLREDALARAWKTIDVDPQRLSSSFRGLLTVNVFKQTDAPVLDQLDTTISQMQRFNLEVEPCILEARQRLANGAGAGRIP
jgi:hypothetical protein